MFPDGRVGDTGEILEISPHKRLVIRWRNEFKPELQAEGYSRCTYRDRTGGRGGEAHDHHEIDRPGTKLIEAVSGGWPQILSSLKTLLETGDVAFETKV